MVKVISIVVVFFLSFSILITFAQDEKMLDVIQLKSGSIITGKITKVDDKSVTIELQKGGSTTIEFSLIHPITVYKIKKDRIDDKSAKAHLELAEFAITNQLFSVAEKEFKRALELDESIKDTIAQKLEELKSAEQKSLFEDGVALVKKEEYEEAEKKFRYLMDKYPGTDYAKKANDEIKNLASLIKEREEKKRKEYEERLKKLEEERLKKLTAEEKKTIENAGKLVEESKKLNVEGLDIETKDYSKAIKVYKFAEEKLSTAKKDIEGILAKSKDVDVIDLAKDKIKEVNQWLVIICNNLANVYVINLGNLIEAQRWLNKTLQIDPSNKFALDLKLYIAQAYLQRQIK